MLLQMVSVGDKFAPSFSKKPAIRQEEDGSRLMFECKIKSNPKPIVTWEHDGNTIHAVGRLKVSHAAKMFKRSKQQQNEDMNSGRQSCSWIRMTHTTPAWRSQT
jgi:hypothetical protein